MIRALSPTTPACYGVSCAKHATCTRYAAVETTSPDHTIATCDDGTGDRPLFVAVVQTEQAEVSA